MPLFRICGADANAARERTHDVLDFCGIPELQNPARRPPGLFAQRRAALARALVHGPRILVGICPSAASDLHDLAWRAADELGVCVLWARQDGSASGKAQRKDSGARRLSYVNSKCECPQSATCLPVGAKKSNLAFALGCLPPARRRDALVFYDFVAQLTISPTIPDALLREPRTSRALENMPEPRENLPEALISGCWSAMALIVGCCSRLSSVETDIEPTRFQNL